MKGRPEQSFFSNYHAAVPRGQYHIAVACGSCSQVTYVQRTKPEKVAQQDPPAFRECVRTQRSDSERQNSAQYRTASVATGCRHSTPALLSVSRNYIGFELNGGIRSLRSRFCTECFDHDQFEFSHSLYRDVVLTSRDCGMSDSVRFRPSVAGGLCNFPASSSAHCELRAGPNPNRPTTSVDLIPSFHRFTRVGRIF